MKRCYALLILVLCLVFSACGSSNDEEKVSGELGIDTTSGKIVTGSDSHGGFHGDGMTFIVMEFQDDQVLTQIQENSAWNALPMDETATALVYDITDDSGGTTMQIGPYITKPNDGRNPLIPEIENGYYILIDRHSDKGNTGIFERASFNFTIGVFDSDSNILYYCEFDT